MRKRALEPAFQPDPPQQPQGPLSPWVLLGRMPGLLSHVSRPCSVHAISLPRSNHALSKCPEQLGPQSPLHPSSSINKELREFIRKWAFYRF